MKKCDHLFGLYSDFCVHCGKSKFQCVKEDKEEEVQKFLNYNFGENKKSKKKFFDFFKNRRFKF